MTTFIALLRAVNVGGRSLKMEALRASLGGAGLAEVRTYVQSGNVVFAAPGSAAALARKVARVIVDDFALEVAVIMRTAAELEALRAGNPFLGHEGVDPKRLHVTCLTTPAPRGAQARLDAIPVGADRARVVGSDVYLWCPDGYGRSKLSNGAIEKALGVVATTRNWNTVDKLCALAAAS